ncbi:YhfG family protein [Microbulbifer sp. JMSA004]|uniref:YhfG family protein n=1 Tax=Microbulbifer sp. JMSA004 TaxID=3243370 RepID=UPI004039AC24
MKNISSILEAKDLDELKALGSYKEIRDSLQSKIDINLKVNGWVALDKRIRSLKSLVSNNKEKLTEICEFSNFENAKASVNELLDLKIKAKSKDDFKKKISKLIDAFYQGEFDPYARFEETKIRNFKSSSRLEGIELEEPDESITIESILSKYRE